jgi:A/G-specific adenine glycosylase
VQRAAELSLMAGMWELPSVSAPAKEPLLTLRHSITTTDYRVFVHAAPRTQAGQWIALDRVEGLPLTGLTRKVLRKLELIR